VLPVHTLCAWRDDRFVQNICLKTKACDHFGRTGDNTEVICKEAGSEVIGFEDVTAEGVKGYISGI
jgi:hypothetical protein